MSKPDWKDAPEGYDYLAQDEDGKWYWFDHKPKLGLENWLIAKTFGNCILASDFSGWKETLERRP